MFNPEFFIQQNKFFSSRGEIKTISIKGKLREFAATRPAVKEFLREDDQKGGRGYQKEA